MRLFTPALCATVAVALLSGCSGSNLATPSSSAPVETQANHLVNGHFIPGRSIFPSLIPAELQRTPAAVLDRIMPDRHRKKKGLVGVYGSEYSGAIINGYRGADPKNGLPICTLSASYPNDIAADGKGNLIDPDTGTRTLIVYKPNCGPELGVLGNSYYLGEPSDAASFNAGNSTIIVGNIYGNGGPGDIAICTLKSGCTGYLLNSGMFELAGVALAKNGDCWGSATDSLGTATMIYFKHCSGSGQAATGWKNVYYGGLDIDAHGNIVAVDAFWPQLWIYRGCNPACTVVGGPYPLHGDTVFGHLNRTGTRWVGADFNNGQLDLYNYSTKAVTYEYSISSGLDDEDDVEGAAFSPSSKE
ncbi:MAG: hypothetical protein WA431_07080 [Candidatus Cybelea sp.]